jgi:hypothetical protein
VNLSIGFLIEGVALVAIGLIFLGQTEKFAFLAGLLAGIVFASPPFVVLCTWGGDEIYPDPPTEY